MKATGALLMSLALSACSSERHARPATDYSKVEVPVSRLSSDEARSRGRALFERKCALCHGERADGNGPRTQGLSSKPASFRSTAWRNGVNAIEVFAIVSEGKRGTSMPAWPTLSDDQKWDVVAYVLSVAEHGP